MRRSVVVKLVMTFLVFTSVFIFSILAGSVSIDPVKAFMNNGIEHLILWKIRLPSVILSFLAGGSLALSGVILQTVLHNPLAEPHILGISAGAALGAIIAEFLPLYPLHIFRPLISFSFSVFVMFIIWRFSFRSSFSPLSLVLAGVVLNSVFSGAILLLSYLSASHSVRSVLAWLMGGIQPVDWEIIGMLSFVVLFSFVFVLRNAIYLDNLSLGDLEAFSVGVNPRVLRLKMFFVSSVLTGAIVSLTGMIGFVGLITPHIVRMLVSSRHRELVVFSFIWGGVFLMLAFTLSRVLAGESLPIGVITALVGTPVFVLVFRNLNVA